jgi:1-acyl-sn-glycerol-3-phosphate acyltransferase
MDRLIHAVCRPTYIDSENIPAEGAVILATNHMSRMDTLLLFINPRRTDVTALVADKYKKYPLFRWILDTGGIIWLDRESADFGALRAAGEALKKGLALGIAPEGTRSTTFQLLEGKPGTALLALRANVPIVPVGISGSENIFRKIFTFRFPKVNIRFGEPFRLEPLTRERRSEQLQEYTDEIMCRIAVLLPEKYHGFYRGHPRVKELMAEANYRVN